MNSTKSIDYSKRVNRSLGQAVILVWKSKPENDASRYEIFRRTTLLFTKYDAERDLGVSLSGVNNCFCQSKTSDPVMYENDKVRIIRTRLYERKDFTFPSEG